MKVTIKDVAREAQVATSTVSRVLANSRNNPWTIMFSEGCMQKMRALANKFQEVFNANISHFKLIEDKEAING